MNEYSNLTQLYSGSKVHKIERGESSGSVTIRFSDGRRLRLTPVITSGDIYREASTAINIESL